MIVITLRRACCVLPLALRLLAAQPADLVLRGGKIVTLEQDATAQAMAARDGKIVAVGTNQAIQSYVGPSTKVIDLNGRLAIPGLIEGHGHFTSLGASKMELNLRDAKNWDEIVAMVARSGARGQARNLDPRQRVSSGQVGPAPVPNVLGFPVHAALSKVSPHNPVWLEHASGHASFANAEAMRLAGIDTEHSRSTRRPDPEGRAGQSDRAAERGSAGSGGSGANCVSCQVSPSDRAAEALKQMELAERECLAKGITTFEDAGSPMATIDLFKQLAEQGKLDLRMWVMLRHANAAIAPNLKKYYFIGVGDQHLTVRAIKRLDRRRAGIARGAAVGAVFRSRAVTHRIAPGCTPRTRPISVRQPSSPSPTDFSFAYTPSATAPIARCSIFTNRSSRNTRRKTESSCAGGSSTRSI